METGVMRSRWQGDKVNRQGVLKGMACLYGWGIKSKARSQQETGVILRINKQKNLQELVNKFKNIETYKEIRFL